MNCRHCNTPLSNVFCDLVNCPPTNAFLKPEELQYPEKYYPLKVFVCPSCFLVQADEMKAADEIFNAEYAYFSSYSTSWLEHAKRYVEMMVDRFHFDENSQVIEIASNDGYLLQYFKEKNIPVLGVDPSANTAEVAKEKGIETIVDFFGEKLAREQLVNKGIKGDLILGNNVLAHVPAINDLVGGMKLALADKGVITMEFPHLLNLVNLNQFDTIYHEHYSYLSLTTVQHIFKSKGLEIFDVQQLPTHGGSLRIFARHAEDSSKPVSENVTNLLAKEEKAGMKTLKFYEGFQNKINKIKNDFLQFLLDAKRENKKVAGYGAASKGNTLINYAGLKGNDLINFIVDASPFKQNKLVPGCHIPVVAEEKLKEYKPDYVIILPWNIKDEIEKQLSYVRDWGSKFVTFIPETVVW